MARQRQIYETAFDCKVDRSEDDLENLNQIVNDKLVISKISNSTVIPVADDTELIELPKASHLFLQKKMNPAKTNHRNFLSFYEKTLSMPVHQQLDQNSAQCQDQDTSSLLEEINFKSRCKFSVLHLQNNPPTDHDCNKQTLTKTCIVSSMFLHKKAQQFNKCLCRSLISRETKQLKFEKKENILEIKNSPVDYESKEQILEVKDRPKALNFFQQQKRRWRPRPFYLKHGTQYKIDSDIKYNKSKFNSDNHVDPTEMKLKKFRRLRDYCSTESIILSSSSGSVESLRSNVSEGNRSFSSCDSQQSNSLSSHSSDSNSFASTLPHHSRNLQQSVYSSRHSTKLQILSPISDKSTLEQTGEGSDLNLDINLQIALPKEPNIEMTDKLNTVSSIKSDETILNKMSVPRNVISNEKNSLQNDRFSNKVQSSLIHTKNQGSDCGILIESKADLKCKSLDLRDSFNFSQDLQKPVNSLNSLDIDKELSDLPFDMPKLRRRKLLSQPDHLKIASNLNATNVPSDMHTVRLCLETSKDVVLDKIPPKASDDFSLSIERSTLRPKLTLNLDRLQNSYSASINKKIFSNEYCLLKKNIDPSLGLPLQSKTLQLSTNLVDVDLPLERQSWYHGTITRIEAEEVLRLLQEGSYLVRNGELTKQDYSLSLKSAKGFMHMRIQKNKELNAYILGQFSKPFESIPKMIRHFSVNRLPIRGAEHMCLLHPVIAQLL